MTPQVSLGCESGASEWGLPVPGYAGLGSQAVSGRWTDAMLQTHKALDLFFPRG